MQEAARKYHRRSRRITIEQPVKLCPAGPRGEFFKEISTTNNLSREGFYFLTNREHAATINTSLKLFGSKWSTTASVVSLSNSCRRSEALSEITGNRSMFLRSQESFVTDAKTHWCLLVFRCVSCGKNEAFAEDSFKGEPREDQFRPKIYQAICRYCGWEGEVRGLSAVEMRSGAERRTGIRNKQGNRPMRDG